MSANVIPIAGRRPAPVAPPSAVQVSAEFKDEFYVVVTVLDEHGEPVEGRLSLAAARAHVDQVEVAIQVGEELESR